MPSSAPARCAALPPRDIMIAELAAAAAAAYACAACRSAELSPACEGISSGVLCCSPLPRTCRWAPGGCSPLVRDERAGATLLLSPAASAVRLARRNARSSARPPSLASLRLRTASEARLPVAVRGRNGDLAPLAPLRLPGDVTARLGATVTGPTADCSVRPGIAAKADMGRTTAADAPLPDTPPVT